MSPPPSLDETRAVRLGEELDVAAVDHWLKTRVPGLAGAPTARQFGGGASNWTYLLAYPDRELVLRRPPAGTRARSAHDMGREFGVQQALKPVYPVVPAMVALCEDPAVIGVPFYVMERVPGLIPRASLPAGVQLDAEATRRLCTNVLDKLIELHRVDYWSVGLGSLGKGAGYPRRQVDGWSERYVKSRTWNVPSLATVREWLSVNTPDDVATCVIHNDFRFDNVVLDPGDPTRVVGVLDWEMATLGDPLMDLGGALAYWVQADDDWLTRRTRRQPTHLPGMLRRDEVVLYYLEATGLEPADWAFYEVFGLFRLAVIAQQIYYRYHHGQSRNPAFRHFWLLVHHLGRRCRRLIAQSQGGR